MEWIIAIVLGAAGIAFGTQAPIEWQIIAFLAWYAWIRGAGEAGMLIWLLGIPFVAGVIIGDINWLIQTDTLPGVKEIINSIGNPFKVDN